VPLVIEARGQLFAWSFRFPGRDRELGTPDDLRFEKELHLPAGVDIELKLESDDYMYIFSNAELGLRQIVVPELTFTVKFQATKAGSFDLLADPLCGWRSLHDDLMGRVIIQSAPEFDAWFDSSTANLASHQ
jgi:cytochrome c oxidase subunit 2